MQISRRDALMGAGAVAATGVVPIAAMARKTAADPVVALDIERRGYLSIAFADLNTAQSEVLWRKATDLDMRMEETPATSIEGVGINLQLMETHYTLYFVFTIFR